MARKEWLRTKIKREIIATRATAIAIEEAREAIYQKTEAKKPLKVSLREHLGKLIDRMDPLKTLAVLALTLSLKTILDSSEELLRAWNQTWLTAKIDNPKKVILHLSEEYIRQLELGEATKVQFPFLDTNITEIEAAEWLICFAVAYLIVEHPEILSMGTTAILRLFVGKA
ncbi:hypothetical protein MUO79_05815 [Candidatus Bathyarchaeota archaeon]|nr:hypothetical protein [Candidatus Bathyarchaeota archaeon]